MYIKLAEPKDSVRWDEFVTRHPDAVNYHRWGWRDVIRNGFGWPAYYLLSEDSRGIQGVLPLIWLKSRMFGSILCSVPFFSTGGILANNADTARALAAEALEIAKRIKCDYCELRHRCESPIDWAIKASKVTLVRDLYENEEETLSSLDTKMRTKIRRVCKSGMEAEFGGAELLNDFYRLFAIRMRQLGTPVYGKNFFSEILTTYPTESFICRVLYHKEPVAVSFLTGFRGAIEANWSSSLEEFSSLRPNMFLYWSTLIFAGRKRFKQFDFGRSTVGSGTHAFKLQWNTAEIPLHWHYWSSEGVATAELSPDNPKFRLAVALWKHTPLQITKLLGPRISRCLP